jgi:hypothetical protein
VVVADDLREEQQQGRVVARVDQRQRRGHVQCSPLKKQHTATHQKKRVLQKKKPIKKPVIKKQVKTIKSAVHIRC